MRHIHDHQDAAYADIRDLCDEGGHDIRAAGRAVVDVNRADAKSAENASEDDTHRDVGHQGGMRREIPLDEADAYRDAGGTEDGAGDKGLAEDFPTRGEIDKRAETGHAADHNRMGKDERGEAYGIKHQTKCNHHIVFDFMHQAVILSFCHCFCGFIKIPR